MTLPEFLLARIAEDEAAARHVWPERFTDRMLAECEAKRRIVDVARSAPEGSAGWGYRRVLRLLALPYADHPDYREEWKP